MSSQTDVSNRPKVKVGFDLDGVLFYNPLRIIRGPLDAIKKGATLHYIPRTPIERFIWRIIHLSSYTPAKGWQDIRRLTQEGLIEPYVITARFSCLRDDFEKCMKIIDARDYFAGCYQNLNDEQPHLYKERMIRELGIQIYIEDNWNIIEHLQSTTNTTIYWVSNFLDANIAFDRRFSDLTHAIRALEQEVKQKR